MEPELNGETFLLEEVADDQITSMLSEMKANLPEAVHVYQYARMLLKHKKANDDIQIFFMAPGGDYKLGVIFYTLEETKFIGSIYCKDEEARKAMESALMSPTSDLPCRKTMMFSGLTNYSHLAAKSFLDKNNFWDSNGKIYWMPWHIAKELQVHLPEGVEIRKLSPEHAEIIDKKWPHRFAGSKEMLSKQIKNNFGLGVFRGDDLLSWAILFNYGGIGAIQTLESERRKGYGRAVVEAISKKLGEMQNDVHLNIVEGNKTSEAFFESLGFSFAYDSHWVGKKSR